MFTLFYFGFSHIRENVDIVIENISDMLICYMFFEH